MVIARTSRRAREPHPTKNLDEREEREYGESKLSYMVGRRAQGGAIMRHQFGQTCPAIPAERADADAEEVR